VDSLWQDIRYAGRTLRRAPLYAVTVAATMGLGLGLLGSAFTLLNAYFIRPINLPNPHALYALSWDTDATAGNGMARERFSLADYDALRSEAARLAELAAVRDVRVMQDDVDMGGLLVTGNYFAMLGARPALGRLLTPADAAVRGGEAVVVLSHRAWRSRYGADPAIVGQRISLGQQRFEVVGVAEPHAHLTNQEFVNFWAPLTMAGAFSGVDPGSERDARMLLVISRLRDGASAASLRAWLDVWLRQRVPIDSAAPVTVTVYADSLATRIVLDGATLPLLVLIMSAFGLVLLVASANVTNLMLARALGRQPEIAVRLALGASRWRVARQLIVESLVLAVPAAAAGLALIMILARAFPAAILATFPVGILPVENVLEPLDPDLRVLAFLAVVAVLSAVSIALAPAARLAGMRLAQASRGEASMDVRRSRLRSGLVAMQIGACALFIVGAMALVGEASRLANPRYNLTMDRVSMIGIDRRVSIGIDPKVKAALAARLQSEPAVEQVVAATRPPMLGEGGLPTVTATASATSIAQTTGYTVVSPGYFPMFDIRIVRGRTFTPAEAGEPIAIVSEGMAATLWPGQDALGQTLDVTAEPRGRPDRRLPSGRVRVIGVAEDVANGFILRGIDPSWVYFPTDLAAVVDLPLVVKTKTGDVAELRAAVAAAVADVAPDTSFEVTSLPALLGSGVWIFRAFSVVASILGLVGLAFAYSGTHAVVSFLVAQRRREFGVRMALGASAWRIVRAMLMETSRTASIGLVAGLAIAAGVMQLLSGSIAILPRVGVAPFVVGAAIVLVASVVAALSPLRAAARIDPAEALRSE
jgi:predicted permease